MKKNDAVKALGGLAAKMALVILLPLSTQLCSMTLQAHISQGMSGSDHFRNEVLWLVGTLLLLACVWM